MLSLNIRVSIPKQVSMSLVLYNDAEMRLKNLKKKSIKDSKNMCHAMCMFRILLKRKRTGEQNTSTVVE